VARYKKTTCAKARTAKDMRRAQEANVRNTRVFSNLDGRLAHNRKAFDHLLGTNTVILTTRNPREDVSLAAPAPVPVPVPAPIENSIKSLRPEITIATTAKPNCYTLRISFEASDFPKVFCWQQWSTRQNQTNAYDELQRTSLFTYSQVFLAGEIYQPQECSVRSSVSPNS
jgi:hypothetical protein